MRPSSPVLWHQLISEAEDLTARTGWGLARTWGCIHRGDYAGARASLDRTREFLSEAGVVR